jgi:hypothetical protein
MMDRPIELSVGQTWTPGNGEQQRQIDQYRAAQMNDNPFARGQMIVLWVKHTTSWSWCSERAFKQWIKRTRATCVGTLPK